MLDRHVVPVLRAPLSRLARVLHQIGFSADVVTLIGFLFGLLSVISVALGAPMLGLLWLLLNRLMDGIDGELARLDNPSDAGGFLDISLDFVFYALFPLGFALADPPVNALPAAVLVASFVGTGASFLAFSSMAGKHEIKHPEFAYKGLYYLDGLAEGTETILFFVAMCLFPSYFSILAWVFAAICAVTTVNRIAFGYLTLKKNT